MSDMTSLISPRSRAPIVYPADGYGDGDTDIHIGPSTSTRTHMSLALGSHTTMSSGLGPHPPSILKGRGTGGGDMSDLTYGGGGDALSRTTAVQHRLEEEASAYKRRLESYRQAQHQQALLVARLQSKLLQYRQRCTDLESKLGQSQSPGQEMFFGSPTGGGGGGLGGAPMSELDDALWKLEQERVRNENLIHLNSNLRGELEETRSVNDTLSTDLQKLSDDWDKLTRQMGEREQLWKQEEQAYSDYYASEHSKLLNLWRRVSATKRDFADMKSSTGRDMAQLKNTIARMSNQISSGVITAAVASPSPQQEAQQASFISQLTQEVQSSQLTQETLRKQLKERDEKIIGLEGSLLSLEEKMGNVEGELTRVTQQDLSLLNNSLREVAKLLLSDFDQYGLEDGQGHDLHLTSSPAIFVFDENGAESPTVFAESVVSAVQAALNKRQLQVHQLQVSLSSVKEQGLVARAHVESLEADMVKAQEKMSQLTEMNDSLKDSLQKIGMERDTSQRGLEHVKNEKNILEQQRRALAAELDSTLKVKNNMGNSLAKLEKSMEMNREEIDGLVGELDKVRDELSSALSQLKMEQELSARVREQLNSVGDDKERNVSENKTLKTQLNELMTKYEDVTFQFERSEDSLKKWKMDAEILGEKLKGGTERFDALEKEKKGWADKARELDSVKTQLEADLLDARNDLGSLRREMLESERLRTDLEGRIEKLISQVDSAENRKSVLESQLDIQREEYLREMSLMNERMEILNEELNHTRKEYEEIQNMYDRTKSDLMTQEKLHMDAVNIVEAREGAIRELTNTFEKVRDEKQSLEELEHTLKTTLIEKNKKIENLEKQLSDLKTKMNSEMNVMKDRVKRAESEVKSQRETYDQEKSAQDIKFMKEITNLKTTSASTEDKIRSDYEEKLKTLRAELEGEKRSEMTKLNGEMNALRAQIDSLRIQYEEALLRAENDKQQGLLLAQQDQQGLGDRIRLLEKELDDLRNEKDKLRRDWEAKGSHEKAAAASLRSELIKVKNELETARQDGVDTRASIETRLADIEAERETALLLVEDLRNKLRSAEERETDVKRELSEVLRRVKDTEASGDNVRKELNDARRSLTELTIEREKGTLVTEGLKEELNRRETDLTLLKKELTKTQTSLKGLERVKAELEAECGTLSIKLDGAGRDKEQIGRALEDTHSILAQTKGQVSRLEAEVSELKVKLETETERRDEAESQWRTAKKLLDESDTRLTLTKSEEERLALKLSETEERYGHREAQLLHLADEGKQREKKLMEDKHNLNVSLMSLQQHIEQLTGKLGVAETRLKSLGEEKGELERQKKEANSKLAQVQSGFKRLGFAPDSMSLDSTDGARRVMATLQTQMAALQQDRDTAAGQLANLRDALAQAEISKTNLEDQMNQLSRNLQGSRSDTKGKDQIIFNLEKDHALKNAELTRMAEKVREMEDAIKGKEDALRTGRSEKEALKEELERLRQRWDENRGQTESKWAKAEVQIRALEGDLNRMSIVLGQKDGTIQGLEDKCSLMQRSVVELEERCGSLTMTLEGLHIGIEKATQGETDWRDKYNAISRTSQDNSQQLSSLQEKLRALQRDKVQLEQERNNLNEKWEGSSQALADLKRQVTVLADKNQKLRQETEDMTRNAIDRQLKAAFSESGKDDLRVILADKLELERKVDSLLDRIRELERENRELERFKDSVVIPLKGQGSRVPLIRDNAMTVLEEENSDLRRKISKMEAEIRDMERRHTKHIGEVTVQVKQERDFELERARAGKLQAERLLEAREGNYRQQIQRLEQQVLHLKEQLGEEIRRRQSFLSRSSRAGGEIRSLRQALGDSLRNVSMDPNTMENETRRLDRLDSGLDHHKSLSQASLLSPLRDPSPGASLHHSSQLKSASSTLK